MKYILVLLSIVLTTTAQSQTVINYDDGSTYTLKQDEHVYVSNKNFWTVDQKFNNTLLQVKQAKPNEKRDYVEPEPVTDPVCWPWGGVAAPYGYSAEACFKEEPVEHQCDPNGFTFGGSC